ncbi:hypothetical protein ACFX2A_006750 [Malus domestica]
MSFVHRNLDTYYTRRANLEEEPPLDPGMDCNMESKQSSESSKKKEGSENESSYSVGAIAAGAAAGIGLLAWGLSALVSSAGSESERKKKTMKAPGKDYIIQREEFERDPKGYFRDLRKN